MTKIPKCPEHKLPMVLLSEGKVIKTYKCIEDDCTETKDVILIKMRGQEFYMKRQKETEAKIKARNIMKKYKEKW